MPTVAYFYGIAIRMYFLDHAPPHFHAVYGGAEAFVSINTGDVIHGRLPGPAARLVKRWALARQAELRENWERGQRKRTFQRIAGPDDE
jgi:hypothetical protein